MNFIFPYIGNVVIPVDELIFFRGVQTTNQLCGLLSQSETLRHLSCLSHPIPEDLEGDLKIFSEATTQTNAPQLQADLGARRTQQRTRLQGKVWPGRTWQGLPLLG